VILLIIVLALTVWAILAIRKRSKKAQARRAEAERRTREELARMRKEASAEAARMREVIREQQRQAKEQERQAEMLEKHEAQINGLLFRIEQAEAIIAHHSEMLETLKAQRKTAQADLDKVKHDLFVLQYMADRASKDKDRAELTKQAQTLSRQKTTLENRVLTLNGKIFTSEQKIGKARFDKAEAERKIA